jgi:hypothetical protein
VKSAPLSAAAAAALTRLTEHSSNCAIVAGMIFIHRTTRMQLLRQMRAS